MPAGAESRLLFLSRQHGLRVGFGQIIFGIGLILTRFLSIAGQSVATLQREFVLAIGLRHGDIVGSRGVGVVQIPGLVVDFGLRLGFILGGVLSSVGNFRRALCLRIGH